MEERKGSFFWKSKQQLLCLLLSEYQSILQLDMKSLYDKYSYPDEQSIVHDESLKSKLVLGNYKSKFHKLVYLDELAYSRKMIQE